MNKITINPDLCNNCNICIDICPFNIFRITKNDSTPKISNEELCVSCGHCVAICPKNAISHKDFSNGSIKPLDKDLLPSDKQIFELIKSRRSIRVFLNKSVEKNKIEKIIQGACFAPSTNNIQSTKYIVVQNKDTINKIKKLTINHLEKTLYRLKNPIILFYLRTFAKNKISSINKRIPDYIKLIESYKSGDDLIIHNAKTLLFFYADKNIGFSDVNADLALQNATFVCQSLGLGCFYAGYVVATCKNNSSINKLLKLKNNYKIYGCLAIGYPKYEFKKWILKKSSTISWI